MTDERIYCDCGCDAPERQAPRWPLVVSGVLLVLVGAWLLVGCTAEAKPPSHVLEVEETVVKRFDVLTACEKFRDDMIVALTLGGKDVPKMRCQ